MISINGQLLRLSWILLLTLLLLHYNCSWLLLTGAGEYGLVDDPGTWFYFYVTTATTIGYGDLSPDTSLGRIFAAIFIMPGSVVLFAAFLGKLSSIFVGIWRKGMQGNADYSKLQGHIVILGWNPEKTPRMVKLFFGDSKQRNSVLIICTDQDIENPFSEKVLFIKGERLTDRDVFHRAAIESASIVIILQETDDQTLSTCLSVSASKTEAHVVAWFESRRMAWLVKNHCPKVECNTSVSAELVIRSAQDPGSSRLQSQLLSTLNGPTQYSVHIPCDFTGATFRKMMEIMKIKHEAIVLGVADSVIGDDFLLNPPSEYIVRAGQIIYFMAAERINGDEIDWVDMAD